MRKFIKVCVYLFLFIIILFITGFIYQVIATNSDKKNYPYPGQLVTVDGKKIHYIKKGTANEAATIILIGGLGATSPTWSLIQSDLQKNNINSIAYDRAGYGWSEQSKGIRDGISIAKELHKMLEDAGVQKPYIVVGHSLGGLYAGIFTSLYSGEVKSLILIESTHPDQYTRTDAGKYELAEINKNLGIANVAAKFGIMRLNNICKLPASYPEKDANEIKSFCASAKNWQTEVGEMKVIPVTMQEVKNSTISKNIPLLIISAGQHIKDDPQWKKFQDELALISKNTTTVTIEGANHVSVWSDTNHAGKVCDAINSFILTENL